MCTFLANEVPSYIPPKLKNFYQSITDRPRVPNKMMKKKKMIVKTTPSPLNAGIIYILTNLLKLPFTHPLALTLQHDNQSRLLDEKYKDCECSELLSLNLNAVFYFRYPKKIEQHYSYEIIIGKKSKISTRYYCLS